ncbi:MAG: hypothetical protein QHH30_09160 [candidate division NC10 bacterium]|nr:hypothetical protein [candidate division NC10 bacterium]
MKIVVRFKDGRIVKGYTDHFEPDKPSLRIFGDAAGKSPIELAIDELKAVFLVKSFEGNRDYNERKVFHKSDRVLGRKVQVKFIDGEVLQGTMVGSDADGSGFFLIPPDPESNNISLFAVAKALISLQHL